MLFMNKSTISSHFLSKKYEERESERCYIKNELDREYE